MPYSFFSPHPAPRLQKPKGGSEATAKVEKRPGAGSLEGRLKEAGSFDGIKRGDTDLFRFKELIFNYVKGCLCKRMTSFFHFFWGKSTENGLKLEQSGFREDRRRNFLNVEVVKNWNELLRESVDTVPLGNI